jgi:septum formation protein
LVLASASPRRKELLTLLGIEFETIASHIEEVFDKRLSPGEAAIDLAVQKGLASKKLLNMESKEASHLVLLAADTIVVLDDLLLGKPAHKEEAAQMLQQLSGKRHEVYTGVALFHGENEVETDFERTAVYMREIAPPEIAAYVQTGEPMDKAGSYALQGVGGAFVERIEGCVSNVIGLPVPKTLRMLRKVGLTVLGC